MWGGGGGEERERERERDPRGVDAGKSEKFIILCMALPLCVSLITLPIYGIISV